jgi:hypothetical protein
VFWFFVVVVVGVFHLERVVVGVFIGESFSFMHQFWTTFGYSWQAIESFCFVKKVLASIGVAPQKEED